MKPTERAEGKEEEDDLHEAVKDFRKAHPEVKYYSDKDEIQALKAQVTHMNDVYGKAQDWYVERIKNLEAHIKSDQEVQAILSKRIEGLLDYLKQLEYAVDMAGELAFPPEAVKKLRDVIGNVSPAPEQQESQVTDGQSQNVLIKLIAEKVEYVDGRNVALRFNKQTIPVIEYNELAEILKQFTITRK